MSNSQNIFEISVEWIQQEAEEKIGRRLSEDELMSVKKSIEYGLLTDIDTVFYSAIENAIDNN